MAFLKINSYTRVLDDGKGSADKYAKLLNESSLAKNFNFLKEKRIADQRSNSNVIKNLFLKFLMSELLLAKENSINYSRKDLTPHLLGIENAS